MYVARLAPQGEAFECAAPCERCEAALRAAGIGGAVWTTEAGPIATATYDYQSVREEDFGEVHRKWAGIKAEPETAARTSCIVAGVKTAGPAGDVLIPATRVKRAHSIEY